MVLWKKIVSGVVLTALVAGGTLYWRIARSGPALVSADPAIKLVEKPCDKAFSGARCGVVIAPLDYNDPKGKTVEIGFVQFPAVGFGNTPTLQLVGGGPGDPITETVKAGITPTRIALYDRSLLFVDPRGIGLSTPLTCDAFRNLKIHPDDPSLQQACADQLGPEAQHFTTENSARDFEQVRQALGIAELDLYGFSYGTNLSAVYASRFPKHVRTLGLDGAYPLNSKDLFSPTHYAAMKRQFKQFCERGGKCKTDEVLNALSWATEELRKAPRPLTPLANDKVVYPKVMQLDVTMLAGMASALPRLDADEEASSAVWRLPFISALLKAYQQKNWADLETLAIEHSGVTKEFLGNPIFPSFMSLNSTITCQGLAVPWKRTSTMDQRWLEYNAKVAEYDRLKPNAFAPFTAGEWGMRVVDNNLDRGAISCPVQKTPLPAQVDQTFTWPDSLPVLVLNADYDFQTPNEDAELAAAQFKKAQYAHFKHHGHAILPASLCAVQLLREFLDNKRVADPMKCYEAEPTGVSLEKGKPKETSS